MFLDFDFGFFFFDVLFFDAPKPAAFAVLETGGICGTGGGRINALPLVVIQSSSRAKVEDIVNR